MNETGSFHVELKNATSESASPAVAGKLRKAIELDSSFRQPEKLLDFVIYEKGRRDERLSKKDLRRELFLINAKRGKAGFGDAGRAHRGDVSFTNESDLSRQSILPESAICESDVMEKKKFSLLTERLRSLLANEFPEIGIVPPSLHLFEEMMRIDDSGAYHSLLVLFMDNFKRSHGSHLVLLNCLHLVAQFAYKSVYPYGQTMALAGLSYDNVEVNEFAVKCFEDWGDPDGAQALEAAHFGQTWLEEYARDVANELKRGVAQ